MQYCNNTAIPTKLPIAAAVSTAIAITAEIAFGIVT
jgi:hypothetical protein